jgi:hypothetical protein
LNAGTSLNWIEYNFMHCQWDSLTAA